MKVTTRPDITIELTCDEAEVLLCAINEAVEPTFVRKHPFMAPNLTEEQIMGVLFGLWKPLDEAVDRWNPNRWFVPTEVDGR